MTTDPIDDPKDAPRESAYDRDLHKLSDEELAKQILELRDHVDAHMREMARRLYKQDGPAN
jgi:hypothetical protein